MELKIILLNNIKSLFKKKKLSTFYNVGFHGDEYLLKLVNFLIKKVDFFIETGTNVGSTIDYVGKKYPNIQCLSCEPSKSSFKYASENTKDTKNIKIFNLTSMKFFKIIDKQHKNIFSRNCIFWLDAHGYGFKWDLKKEIEFITENFDKGLILIDDFKVPGKNQFVYDVYKNQECSFEYIKDSLKIKKYQLYYPGYTEKTSNFHPLKGWGLIIFGFEEIEFPAELQKNIKMEEN